MQLKLEQLPQTSSESALSRLCNLTVAEFERMLEEAGAEILRPVRQDPAAVLGGEVIAVWVEL